MKARYAGGISYLLVIVCVLLVRIAGALGIYTITGADSDVMFTCVVQFLCFGAMGVICWFALRYQCSKDKLRSLVSDFSFRKCSARNWGLTFAIAIPAVIITITVATVWSQWLYLIGYQSTSSEVEVTVEAFLMEFLLVAILPAIFEEIAHRGLVIAGYKDGGESVVFISALLFALMHQNIRQTGYTLVFGFILACVVLYSGSIYPAMFLHFFNNLVSLIFSYNELNSVFGAIYTARAWLSSSVYGTITLAALFIVSIALTGLILWAMRKRAVRMGAVKRQYLAPISTEVLPLYKDVPFLVTVAIGVATTIFSLVWRIV